MRSDNIKNTEEKAEITEVSAVDSDVKKQRFGLKIFPETLFPMGLATAGGSFMSVVFCTGLFLLLQRQKRQEKGI